MVQFPVLIHKKDILNTFSSKIKVNFFFIKIKVFDQLLAILHTDGLKSSKTQGCFSLTVQPVADWQ